MGRFMWREKFTKGRNEKLMENEGNNNKYKLQALMEEDKILSGTLGEYQEEYNKLLAKREEQPTR